MASSKGRRFNLGKLEEGNGGVMAAISWCYREARAVAPATAVAFALPVFSSAQSITQPAGRAPAAMLPAGKSTVHRHKKPFSNKDLASAPDEKKGLRHIAAARKYNREEVRFDPISATLPLIHIKPHAR
ncbi:hypothetical protein [uncultured Herbaspirillum sp.]|uniref:hypothetical protein n=1 Tax=uncultured Herbaspirillum sp. TaxID=160236 RepID=UPI00258B3F27|nr:hypothetical protein [uncultured Herbaspirillum sp.]